MISVFSILCLLNLEGIKEKGKEKEYIEKQMKKKEDKEMFCLK